MKSFLFFISGLVIAIPGFAGSPTRHLFVLGGGGEPAGQRTQFDSGVKTLGHAAAQSGWKVGGVLFDGAHPASSSEIPAALGIPASERRDFTRENYRAWIEEMNRRIDAGGFRKDDQVLLTVSTHGMVRDSGSKTHPVKCDLPGNFEACSLDDLAPVIRRLERAGVRVALVDASCYSGNSLALASERTCVVTAATQGAVGSTGMGYELFKELEPGMSLASAFRKMRARDFASPQISSPAGQRAHALLESAMGSIDTDHHGMALKNRLSGAAPSCERERILFAEIEKAVRVLEEPVLEALGARESIRALRAAISDYRSLYSEARRMGAELDRLGATLEEFQDGQMASWDELASAEAGPLAQNKDLLLRTDVKFEEFLRKRERFASWSRAEERYPFDWSLFHSPLVRAAKKVISLEKEVYETLLVAFEKDPSIREEADPCRDFVF